MSMNDLCKARSENEALSKRIAELEVRCKAAEELVLTPSGNIYGQLSTARAEIEALRKRIAELDHECKAGMEQIASERARAEQAEAQLAEATSRLSMVTDELHFRHRQIDRIYGELAEAKSALSAMEAKVEALDEARLSAEAEAQSKAQEIYVCAVAQRDAANDRSASLEKSVTVLREALACLLSELPDQLDGMRSAEQARTALAQATTAE